MTEQTVDPMSGTGAALVAFLDTTWKRGLVSRPNANAIKVGVREVLQHAEGEDWESKNVSGLDVEDVLRRFETLRAAKYTPGSLKTYRYRFRNAMTMYQGFLQDPGGWRPANRPRATATPTRSRANDRPQPTATTSSPSSSPVPGDDASERPGMMTYPHPLWRDGTVVFARLILPNDLTAREAEKICGHIKMLARDEGSSPQDPVE